MSVPTSSSFSILVRTGRFFDLSYPQAGLIAQDDIVHSLARLCRYTGHTPWHYSVAEHSAHVLWLARRLYPPQSIPRSLQLALLLHDAHEAYVGDISWPLGNLLQTVAGDWLDRLKRSIDAAIAARFRFDARWFDAPLVKRCDRALLLIEMWTFWPECRAEGTPLYLMHFSECWGMRESGCETRFAKVLDEVLQLPELSPEAEAEALELWLPAEERLA